MAQRTVIQFIDDLTGEEVADGKTVDFGLDGVTYAIDLSPTNASALRDALANYVACARKVDGRRSGAAGASRPVGVDNRAVRAWAASNGVGLNSRGRIPQSVIDQFHAAGH